jgi:hypothetical protein
VPDSLRRKLGLKAFRSVMVGYSQNSPWYRVYDPATMRITASVHVKFQNYVPGSQLAQLVDSSIDVFSYAYDDLTILVPPPFAGPTQAEFQGEAAPLHDVHRPSRLRGSLARLGGFVAHVSTVPRLCVTNHCSPDLSKDPHHFLPLPDFSMIVAQRAATSHVKLRPHPSLWCQPTFVLSLLRLTETLWLDQSAWTSKKPYKLNSTP